MQKVIPKKPYRQSAMFEVLTRHNSATITLNDNAGGAMPATWIIGRDPRAIYCAVLNYAHMNGLHPGNVGYSVKFED